VYLYFPAFFFQTLSLASAWPIGLYWHIGKASSKRININEDIAYEGGLRALTGRRQPGAARMTAINILRNHSRAGDYVEWSNDELLDSITSVLQDEWWEPLGAEEALGLIHDMSSEMIRRTFRPTH
jgi:hypothetical protein